MCFILTNKYDEIHEKANALTAAVVTLDTPFSRIATSLLIEQSDHNVPHPRIYV